MQTYFFSVTISLIAEKKTIFLEGGGFSSARRFLFPHSHLFLGWIICEPITVKVKQYCTEYNTKSENYPVPDNNL